MISHHSDFVPSSSSDASSNNNACSDPNSSISCCTFNVHSFKTDDKKDNREMVTKYFIDNSYDIIGLNEAYEKRNAKTPLTDICNTLTERFQKPYKYYYVNTSNLGNAIITWLPVKKVKKKYLKRGPGGPRTVIGVQFESSCCIEFAFVTHLDYIQETMRIQQLAEVMNFMAEFMAFDLSSQQQAPKYVLMGDFNAMHRSDYTSNFWNFLQEMRDKRKWEPVSSDLMNCLFATKTHQIPKHHNILSKLAQQLQIVDPWKLKNKDQLFDGTPNTSSSRFHTRIDYILCSQVTQRSVVESYIDLRENTLLISDHNPVVVRLANNAELDNI
ncbi:hypothetical protein FDP41_003524 [Naegleria fowleri]|uniref:Endonuclease/exonuclease/phosphatase domain-containing protein n=1 Tax=Naegleria fowleri TaxID=5763 RepID=A0A6A5BS66_NAEFO|nr:uncharacterized protein FDP41_003524 [Naegleria fowleri]KAF0977532.1 hypothetical protein FDP41_003524 [Naegleria fowleri]